ncbi:LamG-like jellyroll fold domain-containing protein [Flavobacterium sp. ZS1P14]|uniref:LamG-like jellyroll fold domain-containing protein n=1 Tax=Flavobacterium sp. ZS1P14 TaxID=3401729 RepID=UPI003AAEA033
MKKIYSIFMFGTLLLILGFTQQISGQQTFVHPGIPFTQTDLNQLKVNITQDPWLSAYNTFKNDSHSKLTYTPGTPQATVSRAPDLNNVQWKNDMLAIHNLAFMWWFTGDAAYAQKATDMLDAWAVTNTTWGGNESMLDIGDYAHFWATGAEILRYTYSGWTQANTDHVENYFSQVLYPHSWVPNPLRDQNKGAIQLKIALGAAVFCNDVTKFNQAIEVYRMDAGGGMRNSLPNGEVGDTGRDDHWRVQAAALAWGAEVAYKQNVDMFSELDNRVLAIGELYHKYAFDGATMTYIPFGGYASYWTNWGIQPGARTGDMTNIIYSAYAVRKGISTPQTDRMRAALGGAGGDFLFLKSSDTSTAVSLSPVYYPADHVQAVSNLTNIDIGNTGLAGSTSYSNGIWTLKGAGTSTSTAFSFNFKKVSGDAGLIVKVNNMSLTTGGCGVMLRESLASGSAFWDIFLGANGGAGRHWQPKAPWWLKIERVGTRIFTYHSQDGVNWTNLNCFYSATGFPTNLYAGFYTISNNTSAQNTATFSNVAYSQTAPTGSPEISSATTATATIGASFSYSINASASPSTYSASGLPAGLSINTSTGVISGTPTAIGQSVVTLGAINASGTGTATLILNVNNNVAPAAPSGVTAAVNNVTRISVSWPAVANASSYTVKRSLSSSGPFTAIQTGIIGTSFIDASPQPEVSNYYVVTALAGTFESGNSNVVSASVPPAVPSMPIVVNNSNSIDLSWNAASGAVTYKVKRGTVSGGSYTTLATVSTTSYTDTNVSSGSPYYYVVSSMGNTLESANSAEAFGVPGASTRTWNPTPVTTNLNLASNWVENALPINPAILTLGVTSDSLVTNDINGLVASRIQFASDANAYTISGNALTLKNDLVNNSSRAQTLSTPLMLTDQLNVNTVGEVVLNGAISGTGSLMMKSNGGYLYVNGSNSTYSGNTLIVSGTVIASGVGTGIASNPTAGPLGTGKIQLNGGKLQAPPVAELKLYNDIEVLPGNRSYMYEDVYPITLYGKLLGSGTVQHDGNDYGGLNLLGDNSQFAGTFISVLRSGKQRIRFGIPQSGSANATWLLDANAVDCHGIGFSSGTLNFGALNGRGYIRADGGGAPVISIGALNTYSSYGGTINGNGTNLTVEKVGTGTLEMWGNQVYTGTTTIKKGKLLVNNDGTTGVFISPVIVEEGALGGWGLTQASATLGTGSGAGAILEPGFLTIGTLSVGALTLKADATYTPEINLGTAIGDQIKATSVNLINSPLLTPISIAGTLAFGTYYTLINNTGTGAVTGTFNGLPEWASITVGGYSFIITYVGGDGNDVVLMDARAIGQTYYKFNEASGTQATDTWGTNHGTLQATATRDTGRGGSALKLDGTSTSYATLPTGIVSTLNDFTISTWVKMNVKSNWMRVFDFGTGTSKYLFLSIQAGTNVMRYAIKNGGAEQQLNFNYTLPLNTWTHFAITQSGSTCSMYINGALVATNTGVTIKPSTIGSTTLNYLGKSQFSDPLFKGSMDEFKIFGRALSTAEIAASHLNQTITLNATVQKALLDDDFEPATVSSGLPVTYTSSNESVASIVNGKVHILAVGTSTITATQDGNEIYWPAPSQTQVLTVVKRDQTISFAAIGTKIIGDADFDPSATASSGLAVTYTSSDESVASIVNGKIHILAAGTSTITASQTGNDVYTPAPAQTQVLTVVKQAQTINFAAIGTKLLGDADFDPLATASSGLAATYTSSNGSVASIVNGKVHILGTGTTTITASQAGNNVYAAAQSQTQVLTVVITNNTTPSAVMGTPFTYTITNNTALTSFTATGLPAGLSLNTSTGLITGTPTEYGAFSVALTASNGSISGSQIIALTIYTIVNNVIVAAGDAKNIIEWDAIQNFSYNVKRSTTSGGSYTTIGTVTGTTFTDTNVSNGNTYYYVVSANNTLGENPNSAEVTATPNTGQITYLKFDEPSGTRGIDSWGASHATLQATATRDAGLSGSALKLDGTSTAYTTLPTGIISTLNDFTISTWVRMDVKSNWMRVFDFGTGTSKYMFLTIQAGSANIMRYAIKNGGSEQQVNFTYTLPLNTWTHFAITQSGNTCTLYINGTSVASNTGVSIKPSTLGSTNLNYLGKSQFNDFMFKGSIDKFKIYSRALSAEEINIEHNITSKISQKKWDNQFSGTAVIKNSLIYPNPVVNNRFTIATNTELVGKEVQVKLIDLMGQTIYLKSVKNDTGTIDVVLSQTLPVGIYILILNNQYSAKVIIK